MCIIVDANVVGQMFSAARTPAQHQIFEWLKGGGAWVVGGKLFEELARVQMVARYMMELKRSGRLVVWPRDEVNAEAAKIASKCKSNDAHVIGLARVSGARTLHSEDSGLIGDFVSAHLINGPRGKVYRSMAHVHLLRHSKRCPKAK